LKHERIHETSAPGPRVAFSTLGCRLNRAETDAIADQFQRAGWRVVGFAEEADLYFVNTCTVTGRADRSSRQQLHRARRRSPDALVVAAGCFAAAAADELARGGEVDVVLGVREKNRPFDHLPAALHRPAEPVVAVAEEGAIQPSVGTRVTGRSRAFLKVQDGCDHSCAYCAVTLVRGSSVSAPLDEIRAALDRILEAGFEEVVLTGVDVTAWGGDRDYREGDFVDLVAAAAGQGLPRIRLSSVEPWALTPERMERLAAIPAFCEHLHISLQSGDEEMLSRMGRPTDLERLHRALGAMLTHRPHATFGADLIAGFPGETPAAFERSLAFPGEGPLHYLHVFPFSPRPGTPAADLPDPVDRETIHERARLLRAEGSRRKRRHMERNVGRREELLVEEKGSEGFTRNYLRAVLTDSEAPPRRRLAVRIRALNTNEEKLEALALA
jgi:threonylcarbamoyladenosine tRNA methylthiotransferase MtaB